MDLGKKVASLRKKNNLTQESLAEKIGVTRQTISKWELGETSPDIKQAKLLAAEFNISLDELVNNKSATINITASDSLSGVKRIRLPNGNYVNSNKAVYNINGNGGYVFECEDVAGNIASKAVSINGNNSNLNTEVNKSDNWTNNGVQINIDLRK